MKNEHEKKNEFLLLSPSGCVFWIQRTLIVCDSVMISQTSQKTVNKKVWKNFNIKSDAPITCTIHDMYEPRTVQAIQAQIKYQTNKKNK